jgi:hypothetical protein
MRHLWKSVFLACLWLISTAAAQAVIPIQVTDVQIENDLIHFQVNLEMVEQQNQPLEISLWVLDEMGIPVVGPDGDEVSASIILDNPASFERPIELSIPLSEFPIHSYDYSISPFIRLRDVISQSNLHFYHADDLVVHVPASASAENPDDADGDRVLNETDACSGLIAGASGADAFGCPTDFDENYGLTFDSESHRLWYQRYWTGDCGDLPFLSCFSGEPSWENTITQVLDSIPEPERGPLRHRLWALGRWFGYDWARDNTIRHINNDHLQAWANLLVSRLPDPNSALSDIAFEANVLFHER